MVILLAVNICFIMVGRERNGERVVLFVCLLACMSVCLSFSMAWPLGAVIGDERWSGGGLVNSAQWVPPRRSTPVGPADVSCSTHCPDCDCPQFSHVVSCYFLIC